MQQFKAPRRSEKRYKRRRDAWLSETDRQDLVLVVHARPSSGRSALFRRVAFEITSSRATSRTVRFSADNKPATALSSRPLSDSMANPEEATSPTRATAGNQGFHLPFQTTDFGRNPMTAGQIFRKGAVIVVDNKMQRDYSFRLSAGVGRLPTDFTPALSLKEMLHLGVFEGHYCTDCRNEYPASWFHKARINSEKPDISLNYFRIKSRLPLSEWRRRGWIDSRDPRGWFEWYMRFYLGRRIPGYDEYQISRWRAFRRHLVQVQKNCEYLDLKCRPRQRQALLQWAHDPFV